MHLNGFLDFWSLCSFTKYQKNLNFQKNILKNIKKVDNFPKLNATPHAFLANNLMITPPSSCHAHYVNCKSTEAINLLQIEFLQKRKVFHSQQVNWQHRWNFSSNHYQWLWSKERRKFNLLCGLIIDKALLLATIECNSSNLSQLILTSRMEMTMDCCSCMYGNLYMAVTMTSD